jgi:hypothetical protein
MNGSRRPFPRPFIPLLHGEKQQAASNLAAAVRGERRIKALCRGSAAERGGAGWTSNGGWPNEFHLLAGESLNFVVRCFYIRRAMFPQPLLWK